jgi:hypothetical protein
MPAGDNEHPRGFYQELRETFATMATGDSFDVPKIKAGSARIIAGEMSLKVRVRRLKDNPDHVGVWLVGKLPGPAAAKTAKPVQPVVETVPDANTLSDARTGEPKQKRGRPTLEQAAAKNAMILAQRAEEAEELAHESDDEEDDEPALDPNGMTPAEKQKFFTTLREKFELGIIDQEDYDSRKRAVSRSGYCDD